jgi:hypothetical protein
MPVRFGIVALVLLAAPYVQAQPRMEEARALTWSGDGASAVPAIRRVGIPSSTYAGVSFAGEAGYAITEPVTDVDPGEHHRAFGSIAGAVRPLDWLHIWLRADGRYDVHPDDAAGQDDGFQGLPRLGVRAGGTIDPIFALGLDLELMIPGANAPDVNDAALSFEARALAALRPVDSLTIALLLGFRLDNSGATVPRPVPYRPGDTVALGASDYHAFLTGLGFVWSGSPLEVFGEITFDALIGDAPALGASVFPLRIALGGRVYFMRGLALEIGADLLMTPDRHPIGPGEALVAQEPRLSFHAALRFALPFTEPVARIEEEHMRVDPGSDPEPPVVQARGTIRGRVLDDQGRPIASAQITLTPSGGEPRSATSDAEGNYVFDDLAPGSATLHTEAEGHTPVDRTIEIAAGDNTIEPSALALAVPRGQLRGMIRSYDGRPLEATIRVENLGLEARSDAEGYFEIDVPPGEHTVVIEAPRHRGQRRSAEVPENGVTVMNVDLRRGQGGP